jgi:flagellum-specific peptidoglycan hydrolase FlgJ
MRNNLNHNIFLCLLCVTLLFTMGFDIETRINNHPETTSNPSVEMDSKAQITAYNRSPKDQPVTENITSEPLKSNEPSLHPVPMNEEQRIDELTNTEVTESNYEVTAYYLNVRVEEDGTSKIIDVVTKGTILEVLKPTENGWLELKSGGYIHGKYAKLISGDIKQAAHVKILSNEQTTGKNVVVQAPPPAINVTSAVPSKPSSTVKSNSGLSEEQIAKIFKDTALEGEGLEKAILEIEKMYGINSYFTIAVMKLESGHGKSQIAKTKNNLFGLNAIDSDTYNKALSFNTKGESVEKFGHIISEFYIDMGLTSVEKVAVKYCGANSNWPALVKSIMNSDYNKIL